jgi:muramoyltetrapeptide carboxypeptidase
VVAPGGPVTREIEEKVLALAASVYPPSALEIHFHPQCFETRGHFAGSDAVRAAALVEVANDPAVDAVWFGRGGYGACRIAGAAIAKMGEAAKAKTFLGYSDCGALLGGLYRGGIGRAVHGPLANDILRVGGEAAVLRSLAFLVENSTDGLEPSLADGRPALAYNIAVLSSVLGSPLEPDFTDHVLMIEDVDEHLYRIDRYLFQITSTPSVRKAAGIRMGRIDEKENDRPFGASPQQVVMDWCARSGIAYLGEADIGHDADNKIVPFGR